MIDKKLLPGQVKQISTLLITRQPFSSKIVSKISLLSSRQTAHIARRFASVCVIDVHNVILHFYGDFDYGINWKNFIPSMLSECIKMKIFTGLNSPSASCGILLRNISPYYMHRSFCYC